MTNHPRRRGRRKLQRQWEKGKWVDIAPYISSLDFGDGIRRNVTKMQIHSTVFGQGRTGRAG